MADIESTSYTKQRILDAAEALFAEKGYKAVTVREIVKTAGCNIAAVNYHFGQKRSLYLQVFEYRWIPRALRVQEAFRQNLEKSGSVDTAGIVRALALAFLEGPLSEEERIRHNQLMARELAHPSEAFELVVKRVMRPFIKEVLELLRMSVQRPMDEQELVLSLLSIFSQILYFSSARMPVSLFTGKRYTSGLRERLCEHIIAFSLRGLGMGEEGEEC